MPKSAPPPRRSSRDRSSNVRSISRHPHLVPIDANSMPSITLQRAVDDFNSSRQLFTQLDFVHVADEKIARLFLNKDIHSDRIYDKDGNLLYPPLALRRTAQQIKDFFKLGATQKAEVIEKYSSYEIHTEDTIPYSESSYCQPDTPLNERKAPPELLQKQQPIQPCSESPSLPHTCAGVCISSILDMRYTPERRDEVILGFVHTIREGWTTRQRLENPNNIGFQWPFEPPVVSCLTDGNDPTKIVWKVEELVNGSLLYSVGGSDYGRFTIRHVDCSGAEVAEGKLCNLCQSKKRGLQKRFDSNILLRTQPFDPKYPLRLDRTLSLSHERSAYWTGVAQSYARKIAYRDKAIKKLTEETGVDVAVNSDTDKIFDTSVAENVSAFLKSDPNDNTSAIADYVFKEACQKYKQAKEHGRKSIRHSPLVLRLGIAVFKKMGYAGGMYDLLAKCLGLPTSRNIRNHTSTSASVPFGIIVDNLEMARQAFNEEHPDCPLLDELRHVILSYDEFYTKGRLNFSFATGELTSVEQDCFNEGVIAAELAALDPKNQDDDSEEIQVPNVTKRYLAFIATTLSTKTTKRHIFVARYNVNTSTPEFLARKLLELPATLFDYGFISTMLGNDGANENRTCSHLLATVTAQDILTPIYGIEALKGLPLDFKIAYRHPSPACEDILILLGGDMPHWVKKFRNVLDNKKKKLTYQGKLMNLKMLFDIWEPTITTGASLRVGHHLTYDHFELDSFKKMRVILAVQVSSRSTCIMVDKYCEENPDADINDYRPLLILLAKVDRLVDICNGYSGDQFTKSFARRDVEYLNHPKHRHIFELFDILREFEKWRVECGGFNNKYMTWQTYEDLKWLVFGWAGYAALYLKEDESVEVDQGRGGSDVMEHFFGEIRSKNSNPDAGQADQIAGRHASANSILDTNMFKRKAGTNTMGAKVDKNAYIAPMPKKKK